MEGAVIAVVGVVVLALLVLRSGIRVINQIERGVVFRWGKAQPSYRQPGITFLIPVADRMRKVNIQVITMLVPTQEGITKDNVSVKVDAVVYFRVTDPVRASIEVQDYMFAVGQVAQSSLRSIIGKSDLDDLLSDRERLHEGLALMIDSPAAQWGIHIDRVEIKDVQLPESLKRSMSRQAEAERERRARVITADGEFQAAQQLANASRIMADSPEALQLRLLQTVVEVAAEKNSTLVMPFPVELLRYFDRATKQIDQNIEKNKKSAEKSATSEIEKSGTSGTSEKDDHGIEPSGNGIELNASATEPGTGGRELSAGGSDTEAPVSNAQ